MAETTLPDLSLIWSSAGDILKPSDSKIQQGWQAEIPPRQWFNWLDNRQDQAIAHIAQHGIAVWSDTLEYQAGKSYVQGSDGLVYKALTTNTNINPVGGAPGNWESAFLTTAQAVQVATAAQSRAMTANNVYLSPLQLANAFTGTNQSLTTNGFQVLPGGLIIQWGSAVSPASGSSSVITLPKTYTTSHLFAVAFEASAIDSNADISYGARNLTTSSFTLANRSTTAIGTSVRWMSLGF
jgi:hypothetical protein